MPATIFAADLVNINTADKATLMTLTGLGGTGVKAQAVIDYRTQNGPFQKIEDIMNVSGIGQATFNGFKDRITVGDTASNQTQPQNDPAPTTTPTQTQTAVSLGGYGPPPITAQITAETVTAAGAGTAFTGAAFGQKGDPLAGARYVWNFGDGGTAEGTRVLHTYEYPGDYDVQLSVGYNYSSATVRVLVTAKKPQVALVAEGDGSLTIVNQSSDNLDIGFWSLVQGSSTPFVIPEGTIVMSNKGIRFSPAVLRFVGDETAMLRYSNGALAASAAVGKQSPLRGQVVDIQAAPAVSAAGGAAKAPAQKVAMVKSVDQPAAVAMAGSSGKEVVWSYLVGLAAVIALGAVGTYYAHIRPKTVTDAVVDEFDIE